MEQPSHGDVRRGSLKLVAVALGDASFRPMSRTNDNTEITALLAGIPQRADALGQPAAPVTLAYFADLQCPYCRDFSLEVLPSIIERWVRSGKLRIESHALQAATQDPAVFMAQQVAALAAGRQERAWHFTEIFYAQQGEENSGYVTDAYLHGIASQVTGLDLARWGNDRHDPELANEIASDARTAENAGLTGTPSFLIGGSGDTMSGFSRTDPRSFDLAIEELLNEATRHPQ
jgi:protein-disulfide isomerase